MRYMRHSIMLIAVLISTAYANVQDLGNGQYVAVIQSDSSQTGSLPSGSVEYYMQIDTTYDNNNNIVSIDTTWGYEGIFGNLTGTHSYSTTDWNSRLLGN